MQHNPKTAARGRFANFQEKLNQGTRGRPTSRSAPARAAVPAASRAPAAPVAAARFTQADIDRAVALALSIERSRVQAVFASPASRGRERGCAALLTASKIWTANQITSQLPHLPTDSELSVKRSRERSQSIWDKANATIERQRGSAAR